MSTIWSSARDKLPWVFSTICLVIMLVATLAVGCSVPTKSQTLTQVRSIKQVELRAIEQAQKWKTDAYLESAEVHGPVPEPDPFPVLSSKADFSFRSFSDPLHQYGIDIYLDGRIETREFPVSPGCNQCIPIEPTDWTLDSPDAWRIAWANGGEEFARKHPTGQMPAIIQLNRWNPAHSGPVQWYISINDMGLAHNFRIYIDAKTGQVLKKVSYD